MMTGFDTLLGVVVLAGAAAALYAGRRVVAIMSFLVLGLLLMLLWARLGAPDIAIAEAAIASGVTGALLLAAATEHSEPASRGSSGRARLTLAALEGGIALTTLVLVGWVAVVAARTVPSEPLQFQAGEALSDAVVEHPITAVLLDFRAYDTLLEIAVLAAAVVAALSLLTDSTLRSVEWTRETSPVVIGFAKVVAPIVVMLAGWILVAGSTQPGGAFQAGAVLTGGLLLLYLSGQTRAMITGRWAVPAALAGLALFIAAGAATFAAGREWLDFAQGWGGSVVVVIEGALAISIGAGLAALFIAGGPERRRGD
ncbi:DUF4040 domain-containing protein [Hoyosella sp. YIM 151337]|uniref:hydrogenase subunit MbhD domain-containing protein n=1 Tax=Hoyosella sp. YIM 151337 TaxID=2992742 RepID=UPI002235714C|nr:hydrogenase subunit MbhD domain-containing protein [Hoyosella sp. YIM 151337]MCW4353967.1 DUF4040 domain-containing protein [Hoyosella sp. YIM 151337]